MQETLLAEAKRLYDLGFGVHWIKKNSKAPVENGWTKGPRQNWKELKATYREGRGLGVRLGSQSELPKGYLANIDVDIKSSSKIHRNEALEKLEELLPGLIDHAPIVKTSYGFRLFCVTKQPAQSLKLHQSEDECIVFLPTSPVNRRQLKALEDKKISQAQLDEGYRIRPAWEIEFMSEGRQVVLPPSIHPETGKAYLWERELGDVKDLPRLTKAELNLKAPESKSENLGNFTPSPVWLEFTSLSPEMIRMIQDGENVSDRSAACFSAAMAMSRAGMTDNQIMTVLTDKDNYLGEAALERRGSRQAAADWVLRYCIQKARKETDDSKVFGSVEGEAGDSSGYEDELIPDAPKPKDHRWKAKIHRTGKEGNGPPAPTLKNVVLILENDVSPEIFKRDLFKQRDFYGAKAPWESEIGAALTDDDAVFIVDWLSRKWFFEPPKTVVFDAMVVISNKNKFHPIRDYLRSLPMWDGKKRLNGWLKENFGCVEWEKYLADIFRKWMVAAVARVFEPGKKYDEMLLLQGQTGFGKTTFADILFGEEYTIDKLPKLDTADAALQLRGKWCCEFGELTEIRKNEIGTVKNFLSRRTDKVRAPYGRREQELRRQNVFLGTTNDEKYLVDDTGNRRFNPTFITQMLDFEKLTVERDQLWAEALYLYDWGLEKELFLTGDVKEYAEKLRDEKMVETDAEFMVRRIEKFISQELKKPAEQRFNLTRFRLLSLFDEGGGCLASFPENAKSIKSAANALRKLGATTKKIKGSPFWGFENLEAILENSEFKIENSDENLAKVIKIRP